MTDVTDILNNSKMIETEGVIECAQMISVFVPATFILHGDTCGKVIIFGEWYFL